jgi:hypothetical protein
MPDPEHFAERLDELPRPPDLRLVLSAPGGGPGGGQAMPDGTQPPPGGWNRFQLEVSDLEAIVGELRQHGTRFRNEIVNGVPRERWRGSRRGASTRSRR